ncbi:hypothetical protein Slin15195_G107410 [Septoria linicola]|uniref:Uncharacterized protein n=1 Tax=Septoria linicola TaxID=215465 RepID=A0A9Q9EP83_9PEZI|nr:hypothetical protein Slin14017_G070360 [Septoria linicola]USW57422.1 hypothetical protein Slin15195_G107410 [Septoria linicola]
MFGISLLDEFKHKGRSYKSSVCSCVVTKTTTTTKCTTTKCTTTKSTTSKSYYNCINYTVYYAFHDSFDYSVYNTKHNP